MIGDNVTEMIAEAVAARKLETTGHEIIKTVHPHPTMSEAIMEAAAAAYDEVIHLQSLRVYGFKVEGFKGSQISGRVKLYKKTFLRKPINS